MRRYVIIGVALFIIFLIVGSPLRHIYAPVKYRELVKHFAGKYNLDWLLVSSIVYHESRFRYNAVSNKGAIGLMQIMPDTGSEIARKLKFLDFSTDNLYRPLVNLEFGCYYFSKLLKEFNNDIRLALAAYNAGKGTVYKCISLNDNPLSTGRGYPDIKKYLKGETRHYVRNVNNTYRLLKVLDKFWHL
jgi:soluble lytic murein transglycosylase